MKKYVIPTLECVELKVEERLASTCTGSCTTNETVIVGNRTITFVALGLSN